MRISQRQADGISAGLWLIGLGVLFATSFWWPGIMFVIGATSLVQGLVRGRGWYALQAAVWTIAIGLWALLNYSLAALFIALGLSAIVGAFFRPPGLGAKPAVDNSLE
jgi:hypothetical protein